MFRSIRWRLVLSHTLLSLLAVALVGLLAFALLRRYIRTQSLHHLETNARAIARQAAPFLARDLEGPMLEQLVHAVAFVADARVRIFDAQGRVLADSDVPGPRVRVAWVVPGQASGPGAAPSVVFLIPPDRGWTPSEDLPGGVEGGPTLIPVGQQPSPWGRRITFGPEQEERRAPSPRERALLRRAGFRLMQWLFEEGEGDPSTAIRVRVPIRRGGQLLGYVEVSNPADVAGRALRTIQRLFWGVALGVAFLAGVVGWLISRSLTGPLQSLSGAAQRMARGDLATRAPESGSAEIREVARQFNRMAEQLQRSFQDLDTERNALRRFIADTSHELRTPITALRNFVELLLGPAGDDPETRTEFLRESQQQVERLSWITAHLLDLSRLDAHLVELHLEPVAVEDLVLAAVAPLRSQAEERRIALDVDVPEGLVVSGDRARLEMVVSNLVENAIKFTPPGGQVRVWVRVTWSGVHIGVEDSGPGVPEEERDRIFERFVRGRQAEGIPGTGLGLAIVKSTVDAHGGRVWVGESALGGSRFVVELPSGQVQRP